MATRAITLTLSVRDADTVLRELNRIGPAGEEAIRRLNAAAQRAAGGQGGLRGVQGAAQAAEGAMGNLASRAGIAGQALSGFGTAGLAAAAGLGALGVGLSTVARAGDDMVASLGRIRAATGSIEAARDVYDQLFKLSLQTGQAVSDSAGQFARFAIASKEIGATNAQAVRLVETMQKAAVVGGASTQEASAAAMQLGQALASGVLQGEELRSILENMPNLASALATQLGVGIGQLRQMGSEGKLTADVVMPALLRAGEEINRQYEQMPVTMSWAFDQLTVAAGGFAAKLDEALGISQGIARSLGAAADLMNNISRAAFQTREQAAAARTTALQARIAELEGAPPNGMQAFGALSGQYRPQFSGGTAQTQHLLNQDRQRDLEAARRELADHLAGQRSLERESREDREADRTDAAARALNNQRRRNETEVAEFRGKLDREFATERQHRERLSTIQRLVAVGPGAGGITEAEGQRLTALAIKERDEALKKLAGTTRRVRDEELEGISAIIREQGRAQEQYEDQQNRIFDNSQQTIEGYEQQLRLMETEAGLLSGNADMRDRELAIMRERLKLQKEGVKDEEQIARRLQLVGEIYDRQLDLTQRKNSFNELSRVGEQAFDRIGSAITQAFADGSMKAIDFGNITKSVLSEIAQAALRMAVVNPILNATFGGSRGTLSGLMGSTALSPNGSVGALGGTTDYASAGGSALKSLFGGNGTASSGVNTGWSWLDSGLNSTAWTTGTPAAGWSANMYGPYSAADAAGGLSNVSYAQAGMGALGVAGGLYGIYTGAQQGGAKGWATGASGAFGTVAGASTLAFGTTSAAGVSAGLAGAGMGAGASAALGAIAAAAPYVAAVLAIASLFLPGQKPSDMTGVYLGNLHTGTSEVTGLGGARYSQENRDQATAIGKGIADLGESLKNALGVSEIPFNYSISLGARDGIVAGYGGRTRSYEADEAGSQAMMRDITVAMIQSMRDLASAEVQSIIDRSGGDTEKLLGNLDWYNGTYKAMTARTEAVTEATSAFGLSLTALRTDYQAAIDKATELGLSVTDLTAAMDSGLSTLTAVRDRDLRYANIALEVRSLRANGEDETADLKAYDLQAVQERESYAQSLQSMGIFGQRFTDQVAFLEQVQADERLAIIRRYGEQAAQLQEQQAAQEAAQREQALALDKQQREAATQTAASMVTSLTEFARGLRYGETSSLSYRDQYNLASADFGNTTAAALAGDWQSIQQVQAHANTFLSASRAVNGSGTQATADQNRVLEVLGSIAGLGTDRLTESARTFNAISDQTVVLGDLLRALLDETRASRVEARQAATKPGKIA